ncbi:MAG TPA: DUF72 domain-containing protein [Caulobacteraceae bacterium]
MAGAIRVGIGGWTFPPWRGEFYPKDVRQKDELAYASRKLTAIEVNGTYYSGFSPATFAKWAAQTPDGFVFSLKASRFCTNRRVLAEAGESVGRFFAQGIAELGDRLGPISWQFANTKKFDRDDFAAFLDLLPALLAGRGLRHSVEVRHDSFRDTKFVDLCRERGVAICAADHEVYPLIADVTADFVYARLMRGREETPTCYEPGALDAWAGRLRAWAEGGAPDDLPLVAPAPRTERRARDVFAFFISGGKPRAPAGAMAMIERLGA